VFFPSAAGHPFAWMASMANRIDAGWSKAEAFERGIMATRHS
jgi:hypothetical protein